MNHYLKTDPWHIIEEEFHPEQNRVTESLFSLGNGYMGQRGCLEETFSGPSHRGVYLAGVYFPDPTVVGWWKNGYPEYYGKIIHGLDWVPIEVLVNGNKVDLATCQMLAFRRDLDMSRGVLKRTMTVAVGDGSQFQVQSERFVSLAQKELGITRYRIHALNRDIHVELGSILSGEEKNRYSEKEFLHQFQGRVQGDRAYLSAHSRKLGFQLYTGMTYELEGEMHVESTQSMQTARLVGHRIRCKLDRGKDLVFTKYAVSCSSRTHSSDKLHAITKALLADIKQKGFEVLFADHCQAWKERWNRCDVQISGDPEAQQGIRFNLFQLYQSFDGADADLNISPKGFTGEVYGGGTYWDTEAFCLPYVMENFPTDVARNLLLYRYRHLPKAIENAAKLGFENGAALYPMVTFNGEECHNEWEITFEEIHRNGAIAYAVVQYSQWTGDWGFLWEFGLEMLIGISRFWAQRVHFSQARQAYVMLGVTGPNEYENNVHNNWYTNKLASWTLQTTAQLLEKMESTIPESYRQLIKKTGFASSEHDHFKQIGATIFEPFDQERGIFLQQDGYLDKELLTVKDLLEKDRPLCQKWSWDRILRSCFVKQADVLQGIFMLKEHFSLEDIRRNFEFYEPRTVHESSLSPSVHSILASWINKPDKALEMFRRSVRLDLENINHDTEHGCHITSMGGSWMTVFHGILGVSFNGDTFNLAPNLPPSWQSLRLVFMHRNEPMVIELEPDLIQVQAEPGTDLKVTLHGQDLKRNKKGIWAENLSKTP